MALELKAAAQAEGIGVTSDYELVQMVIVTKGNVKTGLARLKKMRGWEVSMSDITLEESLAFCEEHCGPNFLAGTGRDHQGRPASFQDNKAFFPSCLKVSWITVEIISRDPPLTRLQLQL